MGYGLCLGNTRLALRRRTGGSGGTGVFGRLVAPLRLGGAELLPTLVKLGSCMGVGNMRRHVSDCK